MTVQPDRKSMEPWIKDDIHFYSHQIEGVRRMATMRSALLCDEMGLGKSLQAITVFAIDVKRKIAKNCLIVAPASLKSNWSNEIEQFTGGFHVEVIGNAGTNMGKRQAQIENFARIDQPKFLIVNYEQVKALLKELNSVPWDMVIFDEAHMIKNPTAKRTKACHSLLASRFLLLTGSPLLNHVNDLWSLLKMTNLGDPNFPSYYQFLSRYARYGGWGGKQIVGIKNENELYASLHQVMIRRLKKDVLDLPSVQFVTRFVELTNRQKKMYNQIVENMQLTFVDDEGVEQTADIQNPLTKYLRLKQICGTSATVDPDTDDSLKLDSAVWDAESIMLEYGERVVAFTQFRGVLSAYEKRMIARAQHGNIKGDAKFPVFVLHGGVPIDERQEIVNAWRDSKKPGILICMFQVAGVGLNMTAARYGQFLDKLYVPKLNQQAVDRMHRIGASTTQPVTILEYRVKDTAEDRVEKILAQKEKVSNSLVEDNAEINAVIQKVLSEEKVI